MEGWKKGVSILFGFLLLSGCNTEQMNAILKETTQQLAGHQTRKHLNPELGRALGTDNIIRMENVLIEGFWNFLSAEKDKAVKRAAVEQKPVVVYVPMQPPAGTQTPANNGGSTPPPEKKYRIEATPTRERVRVDSEKLGRKTAGRKVHYRITEENEDGNRPQVVDEGYDAYISETDERVPLS